MRSRCRPEDGHRTTIECSINRLHRLTWRLRPTLRPEGTHREFPVSRISGQCGNDRTEEGVRNDE